MLAKRRHQKILDLLASSGEVQIQQLAHHFGVSTMTIRRDLEGLADEGLVERIHGGAILPRDGDVEPSLAKKQAAHQKEKQEIATAALKWVVPGMSVILDAGSTTAAMAERLVEKAPLTVVTTDVGIAQYLSDFPDIQVFLTGGQVKGGVYRLEGEYTLHLLREVAADLAFIGCDGFTETHVYSNTMAQASLKQTIMTAAKERILLADASKFGKVAFSKVAALGQFSALVVDAAFGADARASLRQRGVVVEQLDIRLTT